MNGVTYLLPSRRLVRVLEVGRDDRGHVYDCAYVASADASMPERADVHLAGRFVRDRCVRIHGSIPSPGVMRNRR